MRNGRKINRKTTIAALAVLLVAITIGYAYLSANLKIGGNSNIKSNKWDIHFENVKVTDGSVTTDKPATIDSTKQTINYTISLEKPGDFYEFTTSVVNAGTIDGKLGDNTNLIGPELTDAQKKYLNYVVTYENGNAINKGDLLKASDSKNVLVRVEYKKDLENADLPKDGTTLNLTFNMEYVQDDGTSKDITESKPELATKKVIELAKTDTTNLVADDETVDHNTRYIGVNPNNYVKFNNELWRIIGVMNNVDDGNGNKSSRIKLIRNETLGEYSWDTSASDINYGCGTNDWSQAYLMKELNTDYLGNVTIGTDGKWYDGENNSKDAKMPTTKLSGDAQKMIDDVDWNLGGITEENYTKFNSKTVYDDERGTTVYGNNPKKWHGKVALMYPSDYGFATSGGSTTDRTACLAKELSNWDGPNVSDCKNNDWLYNSNEDKSTLTTNTKYNDWVLFIYDDGNVGKDAASTTVYCLDVYPSVYLKPSVKITSGNGSISNPFTLSVE